MVRHCRCHLMNQVSPKLPKAITLKFHFRVCCKKYAVSWVSDPWAWRLNRMRFTISRRNIVSESAQLMRFSNFRVANESDLAIIRWTLPANYAFVFHLISVGLILDRRRVTVGVRSLIHLVVYRCFYFEMGIWHDSFPWSVPFTGLRFVITGLYSLNSDSII